MNDSCTVPSPHLFQQPARILAGLGALLAHQTDDHFHGAIFPQQRLVLRVGNGQVDQCCHAIMQHHLFTRSAGGRQRDGIFPYRVRTLELAAEHIQTARLPYNVPIALSLAQIDEQNHRSLLTEEKRKRKPMSTDPSRIFMQRIRTLTFTSGLCSSSFTRSRTPSATISSRFSSDCFASLRSLSSAEHCIEH